MSKGLFEPCIVQKLNQGTHPKSGCYRFRRSFLFLFGQAKRTITFKTIQRTNATFAEFFLNWLFYSLLFFLIKKEAKKSRTKDVHRLRPAAITIGCAMHSSKSPLDILRTVASAFIACYSIFFLQSL